MTTEQFRDLYEEKPVQAASFLKNNFAKNLFALIYDSELPPGQFADHIGVNRSVLYAWTRSERLPSVMQLLILCGYVGIEPSDLLLDDICSLGLV